MLGKRAGLLLLAPLSPPASASRGPGHRNRGRYRPTHTASFVSGRGCRCSHDVAVRDDGADRILPPSVGLHVRRKGRKKRSSAAGGGGGGRRKDNHDDSDSSTTPEGEFSSGGGGGTATRRPPATLAGIAEDHRYEQFFYDDSTAEQLYQLVDLYERPLLLCNPSLAIVAERRGRGVGGYKLLDRDGRFDFLEGYESFDLAAPHMVSGYDFDAVFVDPPFANVTPDQVARCLRLIGADGVPLWVAYNSRREGRLLEAMNGLEGCPDLERKWSLSYKEGVSLDTQDSIWLYGPKQGEYYGKS